MKTLEEYRDNLLAYLHVEQDLAKKEIEDQKQMSHEEKVEANVLMPNITVVETDGVVSILNVPNNYSRLRAGDSVLLRVEGESKGIKATILDNLVDTITVSTLKPLDAHATYELEVESLELLQSLIGCLEGISAGKPGASLLRVMAEEIGIETEDFLYLDPTTMIGYEPILRRLNKEQLEAVKSMLNFPPLHVLQGPPGTGKTLVLAATAVATAKANREVVVIANTHHAVNNALLKIKELDSRATVFKIGEQLKAEELGDDIIKFSKFSEYNEYSKSVRRKKRTGHIIGMTIWGAITYLGLHQHSHFRPYMALVDEASQMPLTYASILGKCATSICLFGDSRQMPPIFRPELEQHQFSISILDYCYDVLKVPSITLTTTYRMNSVITQYISRHFYEPHGVTLCTANTTPATPNAFTWCDTLCFQNSSKTCRMDNAIEANAIAEEVADLLTNGVKPSDIAIITPYRKQVVQLRKALVDKNISLEKLPLVDTVERLQGQDVEYIFLSFASTVPLASLSEEERTFLLNPNRLNVMISRARSFVRIYSTVEIWQCLTQ